MEKIEAVYKKNPLVEQIWVYGNSFENILVAVVVPAESALTSWAADAGISGDLVTVTQDPQANTYVWTELNKTAKEAKLKVRSSTLHLIFLQGVLCDGLGTSYLGNRKLRFDKRGLTGPNVKCRQIQ